MRKRMRTTWALRLAVVAAGVAVCISQAGAQDLGKKAPPQVQPIVIENATIHTVVGETIENGYVYFKNGVIEVVGRAPLPRFAEQVRIIDGTGKHVYPGLIAPYTQLGLTEIAAVRATLDMGEVGVGTPEARAAVAVNPDSTLLPVARSNGVLVAGVFPRTEMRGQMAYFSGPGGMFPGRASVMTLDGWTWEDMTVLGDAGLVINWPFPRPVDAWWMNKSREEQQKDIDRAIGTVDEFLTQAAAYTRQKSQARIKGEPLPQADIRFDAMESIFPKEGRATEGALAQRPVFIEVNDYDAIQQAVAMCAKHKLRCVLIGGNDAPLCAELLIRHNVSVIVEGTLRFPKRDDLPYDDAYALPKRLEDAGVAWCLASSQEAANERNLSYAAGMAVAFGLDRRVALQAITLRAAQILGVAQKLGSIEPGKSATLFLADGDVLEVTTNVTAAFIDGRQIDLSDKQKALAEKYREKYRQKRGGNAPAAPAEAVPQPTQANKPPVAVPVSPETPSAEPSRK